MTLCMWSIVLVCVTVVTADGDAPIALPQTGLVESFRSRVREFFVPPSHDHPDVTYVGYYADGTKAEDGGNHTMDLHEQINKELGPDEERVMAKGEVVVRKKRHYCKTCYQTPSYGYGGGGGCCGACGQCGVQQRPTQVAVVPVQIKIKIVPVRQNHGGGCGRCGYRPPPPPPCGVCGRK